jgi:hypothetical protein
MHTSYPTNYICFTLETCPLLVMINKDLYTSIDIEQTFHSNSSQREEKKKKKKAKANDKFREKLSKNRNRGRQRIILLYIRKI